NKASYLSRISFACRNLPVPNYEDAVKYLENAVQVSETSTDKATYYGMIATVYAEMEPAENAKALQYLEKAVSSAPGHYSAPQWKEMISSLKKR
ncbi:MAG TPA: tetratricopeptide repeat protein, partial [Leptospiraceae bacterium]|nr:tetratricopeptide repeat protein [Leptospiraceae bacterium]